jgi:hypothetical protein
LRNFLRPSSRPKHGGCKHYVLWTCEDR